MNITFFFVNYAMHLFTVSHGLKICCNLSFDTRFANFICAPSLKHYKIVNILKHGRVNTAKHSCTLDHIVHLFFFLSKIVDKDPRAPVFLDIAFLFVCWSWLDFFNYLDFGLSRLDSLFLSFFNYFNDCYLWLWWSMLVFL